MRGRVGFQKSYVIIRVGHGKCLRLLTRGVGGSKNGPKNAYVIFEWSLSSNVASVDAIPCILVSALQTYHRLTVDVTHFLASTNPRLSRNSTFCNLQDIDTEDEERPLPTTVSSRYLIFLAFS